MTQQQTTASERLERLTKLETMNMLDPDQKKELDKLRADGVQVPPAVSSDGYEVRDINTDAFKKGWSTQTLPPPQEGLFLGICTGTSVPANNPNDLLINMESLPGSTPEWRGSYYIDEVNNPSDKDSRAGKFKDVLEAFGLTQENAGYKVQNGKLLHKPLKGLKAKARWVEIEARNKGKQRRIQEIVSVADKREQAS